MLARPYHPSDAKRLDEILKGQGITHPGLDEIFVTGPKGAPQAVLCCRPGAFVHELEIRPGVRSPRLHADALANYAIAVARSRPQTLTSAILLVRGDNLPMLRWAYSIGAVPQTDPGDVLFTLTPA